MIVYINFFGFYLKIICWYSDKSFDVILFFCGFYFDGIKSKICCFRLEFFN